MEVHTTVPHTLPPWQRGEAEEVPLGVYGSAPGEGWPGGMQSHTLLDTQGTATLFGR